MEINSRVMPCPKIMAPLSLIVIDCCRLSFSSTMKNCITPAVVIFNDVIKPVSRMAKSVKNVLVDGTRPISRISARFVVPIARRSRHFRKPLLALLRCKQSAVTSKFNVDARQFRKESRKLLLGLALDPSIY